MPSRAATPFPPLDEASAGRSSAASRVTLAGSAVNLVLCTFKFAAGILGNSAAMMADAVHSLSDFATDVVVLATMRITRRPVDFDHDWGHGKFETLASMIIGIALLLVGAGIAWNGFSAIHRVMHGQKIPPPGILALIAAAVSIVTKEALYRWTAAVARRIQSPAVMANAWHHRSDAFSSIGTLAGIGGAILLGRSWTVLDPLAGIAVSFFIIRVALEISYESLREMLEVSLSPADKERLLETAARVPGVQDPHRLRTRRIGAAVAAELHIRVQPDLTVREGHHIATQVEHEIREVFGPNTFVSVHVEPTREPAPSNPGNEN